MIPEESIKYFIKGSGTSGCLCTPQLQDQPKFIQLNLGIPFSQIKEIKLSGLYMVILLQNGTVYRCGTFEKQVIIKPTLLTFNQQIKIMKISCGWDHTLLIANIGEKVRIYGFGSNKFGELNRNNPKRFIKEAVVVSQIINSQDLIVHAGFRQSYWTDSKQLYGCGQNRNYQLGIQGKGEITEPMTIDLLPHKIVKIRSGKKFIILLDINGNVYAMGSNQFGSLCVRTSKEANYLQKLTLIKKDIRDIECGWAHTIFMKNDGRIETYGRNNFGQLGRKITEQTEAREENYLQFPQPIDRIISGTQFSFGLSKSNTLYGWGWNQHENITQSYQIIPTPQPINSPSSLKVLQCITYPAITIIKTSAIQ